MLGPAHVLLCGVTVVVGQVGIKVFLNTFCYIVRKKYDIVDEFRRDNEFNQGLTAKQWAEKGPSGHFGGVILSPSYRHVCWMAALA